MNELSLFTGAGGGLLATQHLLGWHSLGYVEWDSYCQRVLRQRIRDGVFHDAPIFGDIREFIDQGYARRYRGMVDVVTGGFPCPPFSVAGAQRAGDDPRNMWPSTLSVIREIQPQFCFLENVPGILSGHGYFGRILGDLAEIGYDVRWRVLSAAELGAPHIRDRVWIFAYPRGHGWTIRQDKAPVALGSKHLENYVEFRDRWECKISGFGPWSGWSSFEPRVCRDDNEFPDWKHRITASGNGWVPVVAATAWRLLTGEM